MNRAGLLAWGRLLRVSLFPTAVADVLAGLLLGHGGHLPGFAATLFLIAASLCVYHSGLALNDWFDRAHDKATRGDRPLASGAISPRAALVCGVGLALGGVALAWIVAPATGIWMLGVALLAVLYDARGRGPRIGPLLLGLCRAGNLSLGLVHAGALWTPALAAPLLYGSYVFVVSRLGRLEDGEDRALEGGRPGRFLRLAALLLVLVALLPLSQATWLSRLGAFALTAAAAFGLLKRAQSVREWTPPLVGASMGLALRRLLIFSSACALLSGTLTGALVALLLLAGFPVSWSLRSHFPPS